MSEHRVDPTLATVHLHAGPFARSNILTVRSALSKIRQKSTQESLESGRPMGECARDHAHEIMLDYLEKNHPRENGQWIHRPNFGWVFEKEDCGQSASHSWTRSQGCSGNQSLNSSFSKQSPSNSFQNSKTNMSPSDEDNYVNSLKPVYMRSPNCECRSTRTLSGNSYAKAKRMNRHSVNDYDYYSEDELEDIDGVSRRAAPNSPASPQTTTQGTTQSVLTNSGLPKLNRPSQLAVKIPQKEASPEDNGLPISDIQKMFMNMFNSK